MLPDCSGLEILLAHDGELDDVVTLVEEIGARVVERRAKLSPADLQSAWDVAIATPRRLMELNFRRAPRQPVKIGVVDGEARTGHALLQRAGADVVVRRPVHPLALRLFILHMLYKGPEKRKRKRVSVGTPVSYRLGLRRRMALLGDLSSGGCLLISAEPILEGTGVKLTLPAEVAGGKALNVNGKVVRAGPAPIGIEGVESMAVVFNRVSRALGAKLDEIVANFANGPAVYSDSDSKDLAELEVLIPHQGPRQPTPQERRESPRRSLPEPVAVVSADPARILRGRDISLNGMRIDPNPTLSVGDEIRIAVHIRTREEPFVVDAAVERDDGEQGLVLGFRNLSNASRAYLRKVVNFLPILTSRIDAEGEGNLIISEIIERG